MVGWCNMNYPKTLVNPIYIAKETGVPDEKKYDLDSLFQKKNPTEREKVEFVKPLSNLDVKGEEKEGEKGEHPTEPKASKTSSMTLATTSHATRAKIVTPPSCSSRRITRNARSTLRFCPSPTSWAPTRTATTTGRCGKSARCPTVPSTKARKCGTSRSCPTRSLTNRT
jgi:hypothetical protein